MFTTFYPSIFLVPICCLLFLRWRVEEEEREKEIQRDSVLPAVDASGNGETPRQGIKRSLQFSPSALETSPEAAEANPEAMSGEGMPAQDAADTQLTEIFEQEFLESQLWPADIVEPQASPAEIVEPQASPAEIVEPKPEDMETEPKKKALEKTEEQKERNRRNSALWNLKWISKGVPRVAAGVDKSKKNGKKEESNKSKPKKSIAKPTTESLGSLSHARDVFVADWIEKSGMPKSNDRRKAAYKAWMESSTRAKLVATRGGTQT